MHSSVFLSREVLHALVTKQPQVMNVRCDKKKADHINDQPEMDY